MQGSVFVQYTRNQHNFGSVNNWALCVYLLKGGSGGEGNTAHHYLEFVKVVQPIFYIANNAGSIRCDILSKFISTILGPCGEDASSEIPFQDISKALFIKSFHALYGMT